MNRRKFLVGSTAALTSTGLFVGTQGFSSVGSQREVRIQVEGDEDAYLGLHFPDETFSFECSRTLEIPITNQTKEKLVGIEIEPEVVGDGISLDDYDVSEEIDVGSQGKIEATFSCSAGTDTTAAFGFDIEVTGESGDTLIRAQRGSEVSLECECPDAGTSFVAFSGDLEDGDIDTDALRVDVRADHETLEWALADGVGQDALERIVLHGGYGGYDCLPQGPVFINVDDPAGTSGTVRIECDDVLDDYDVGQRENQSQSCPCYETGQGVKYNFDDDGTVEDPDDPDDGCGGPG